MVVCGNDALTHRLALDLVHLYKERLTLVVPAPESGHGPQLLALAESDPERVTVIEGRRPDEAVLLAAGVQQATAIALTMDDDQQTIHAALLARSLNPQIRLVIRVFDRTLGERVGTLLGGAAVPGPGGTTTEYGEAAENGGASTAILSASATAAPALVAAAQPGTRQMIPLDGGALTVSQRLPGETATAAQIPLALLPRQRAGQADPPPAVLLPAPEEIAAALHRGTARAALVLQHEASAPLPRPRWTLPLGALFSRRLRVAALGFLGLVLVLSLANWCFGGLPSYPAALYRVLLDVADMTNLEAGTSTTRKALQLIAAYSGMAITPLILALVLESLGALGTSFRRPPRTIGGHVILIGLGKIGTRVLEGLIDRRVPVVCVERNPKARGLMVAKEHHVPVVIGDVSYPEVYDAARITGAATVMALTSDDQVNLEAVLYGRHLRPDVGVVLRLFDDSFARAVYRALRDRSPHPETTTVSRSVSQLAAPAFAAAMLGRQVLGAIPVERQVLLVAAVDVEGRPELSGCSVRGAFRANGWRVIAVGDDWNPAPDRRLTDTDRVVVVATREGLGLLLQRRGAEAGTGGAGAGAGGAGAGAAGARPRPPAVGSAVRPGPETGVGAGADAAAGDPDRTVRATRAPGSRFRRSSGYHAPTRAASPGGPPAPGAASPEAAHPDPAESDGDTRATLPLPQAPRALPSAPYRPRNASPAPRTANAPRQAGAGSVSQEATRQPAPGSAPTGSAPSASPAGEPTGDESEPTSD